MKIAIVGDGLAAMLLAWKLKDLAQIQILGNGRTQVASLQSAAILTPVANKKNNILKLYEQLLHPALETYGTIEGFFEESYVKPIPILNEGTIPFEHECYDIFEDVSVSRCWKLNHFFQVKNAYKVDTAIISKLRAYFSEQGLYQIRQIDFDEVTIQNLELEYDMICCCEGAAVKANALFRALPFTKNKGDIVFAKIPGLPQDFVYDFALKIVPLGDELFWIGINNIWDYEAVTTEPAFLEKVTSYLDEYLTIPYEITNHIALERPTIAGQKAMFCSSEIHPKFWIINGLGSRGFFKAPELLDRFIRTVF